MANIIISWEYERDASHIARLKRLQKQLLDAGHRAYLIGTNLPAMDANENILFLAAPRAAAPVNHKSTEVTKIGGFGDRLALLGFDNVKTLHGLTSVWDNLFDLIKPQLLICDCAPVASLAAYSLIPCVQLSDGMSLPPANLADFPRLRADAAPLAATKTMMKNVQVVQQYRNKQVPPSLPAIFRGERNYIVHIPEFDPYLTFRNHEIKYGPYEKFPAYPVHRERQHYFAYLDLNYPDVEEIVIGLTQLDKKGIFFIPNASSALQQFLIQSGMTVCTQFPALHEVLIQCAFVIHHGSVAVAEAALAAGLPQFTLPTKFENEWVGKYLIDIGVGMSIYPDFHPISTTPSKIQKALHQGLFEQLKHGIKKNSLRDWADLRAQHVKQKNYTAIEDLVAEECEAFLGEMKRACNLHLL